MAGKIGTMTDEPKVTPPPSRGLPRRWAYVTLAIFLVAAGVCTWVVVRQAGVLSYWNGTDDWRGVTVAETRLSQRGWRKYVEGGNWRNLPFDPSAEELRDLSRCRHLAAHRGVTIDGVNQFTSPEVGRELEAILANRPKLFYARYVLGRWHEARGYSGKAAELLRQAYADAPRIIVQRYQYEDGTPAAGLKVHSFALEHNRVKNHSLDPSLELGYWDLTTDAKGCIYLPAYDTVFRTESVGYPDGLETTYPKLGWFEVNGKVGELPVATVKRRG